MYGEDILESFSGVGAPAMDLGDWASQFQPGNLDVGTFMPAASMGAVPSMAGGGGGVSDWAGRLFGGSGGGGGGGAAGGGGGGPLQLLTQALGLGTSGLGIANALGAMNTGKKQQQLLERGQNMAFSAAQPAIDYGKSQLSQSQAGQLSPAMEAQIAQQVQKAKADARARLAHLGISDSTMIEAEYRRIDNEALALKAQLLDQEGRTGIQALQVGAGGGALQAGQVGANQEALIAQILAAANSQLGMMGARG